MAFSFVFLQRVLRAMLGMRSILECCASLASLAAHHWHQWHRHYVRHYYAIHRLHHWIVCSHTQHKINGTVCAHFRLHLMLYFDVLVCLRCQTKWLMTNNFCLSLRQSTYTETVRTLSFSPTVGISEREEQNFCSPFVCLLYYQYKTDRIFTE